VSRQTVQSLIELLQLPATMTIAVQLARHESPSRAATRALRPSKRHDQGVTWRSICLVLHSVDAPSLGRAAEPPALFPDHRATRFVLRLSERVNLPDNHEHL
jgi:hypothetical protein